MRSDLRLVVIGASAGGVFALKAIADRLPDHFPAAICVVLHVPSGHPSRLPEILNRTRRLPAAHAADGERIQQSRIYIAPPDHHLLIDGEFLHVVRGPRENRQRPAIDPLFRSAARTHGSRVIGVILSGALDDGTAGLQEIKARHGITLVQDPDTAEADGMPRSALEHVEVDACLPLAAIADRLIELVAEQPLPRSDESLTLNVRLEFEDAAARLEPEAIESDVRPGRLSAYTCPECHGPLWELEDGEIVRYRCRVGHAYSSRTLIVEQVQAVERALWIGLRALEENAALLRRLAARAQGRHSHHTAQHFQERAEGIEANAETLRSTLASWELPNEAMLDDSHGG
jgi:two-component system chemotaxis response regulator CheB